MGDASGGVGLAATVRYHIETLYDGSSRYAESNTWLSAFVQQAPEAWSVLLELLGATSTNTVQFFACQGLYLKVSNPAAQGDNVWKSCSDASIREKLLFTIFDRVTALSSPLSPLVGRRLCLLLVHLILRIGLTEHWRDPISDIFQALSPQHNMCWLVEVLTLLPMELEIE